MKRNKNFSRRGDTILFAIEEESLSLSESSRSDKSAAHSARSPRRNASSNEDTHNKIIIDIDNFKNNNGTILTPLDEVPAGVPAR